MLSYILDNCWGIDRRVLGDICESYFVDKYLRVKNNTSNLLLIAIYQKNFLRVQSYSKEDCADYISSKTIYCKEVIATN